MLRNTHLKLSFVTTMALVASFGYQAGWACAETKSVHRTLPEGFVPVLGTREHTSGWPLEIRCLKDDATMVFIPGGMLASGLDRTQLERLLKLAAKHDPAPLRLSMGNPDRDLKLLMIDTLDNSMVDGQRVFSENQIQAIRKNIKDTTIDELWTMCIIGGLKEAGVELSEAEREDWQSEGGSAAGLLEMPSVRKYLIKELGESEFECFRDGILELQLQTGTTLPAESLEQRVQVLSDKMIPSAQLCVAPFYIDKYEVTNAQYRRFIEDGDHGEHAPGVVMHGYGFNVCGGSTREYELWSDPKRNRPRQPVTCVSEEDSEAYARWAGKRLPTRAQWERAATGGGGRLFPWGDDFQVGWCHVSIQDRSGSNRSEPGKNKSVLADGLSLLRLGFEIDEMIRGHLPCDVGSYTHDCGPFGVQDMAGNVSEWVRTGDDEHVAVGGNAESSALGDLVAARRNVFVPTPQLLGFRSVLVLEESKDRSR